MIRWLKKNLFSSPLNVFLTAVSLAFLLWVIPAFLNWAFFQAVWTGSAEVCRESSGACWSFIGHKFRFLIFGTYPFEEQWRPLVAMLIFLSLIWYSKERHRWNFVLGMTWIVSLLILFVLMSGGVFGLSEVETQKWSGLPLTILLAIGGIVLAYPFGILLALGRRSNLPIIKSLSVTYIELIRGVPLISMLFMASVMIPLFIPDGFALEKIWRALLALVLFIAAYLAEVVRAGLQAIPKGQFEAADALGLNGFQKMTTVVLPQALKIVIPPTVNIFIAIFKDTTLVVIISMFDLLGTAKAALVDPEWLGFSREAYVFLGIVYFIFCYAMANYSQRLERELGVTAKQ